MVQGCSRAFLSTPATLWVFTIKYIYMSAKVSTAATGCPGNSLLCLPLTETAAAAKSSACWVGTDNYNLRVAEPVKFPKKKKKKKPTLRNLRRCQVMSMTRLGLKRCPQKDPNT